MRVGVSSDLPTLVPGDHGAFGRPIETLLGNEPPDQGKAVRVDARRRQADQHVANCDVGPRQDLIALDRADTKASQIVVPGLVHPRHLGGLATDQGAAGLAAACRDARDDVTRRLHIELAGREIIKEKQWLGALNDQIVDAHRDEVDADRVVHPAFDCDHQLGADAVVGGNQNRVAIAGPLQVEQAAEATEIGIGAGTAGALDEGLDGLDQTIAGIDIHT